MRFIFITFLILFLSFFNFSESWAQDHHRDSKPYETVSLEQLQFVGENRLDTKEFDPAFFEEWLQYLMDTELIPGFSLCFMKEGNLYWKKDLGLANIENNIPVSDSTLFLVCSISKTVVVTAAMQLYEQGMFDLDEDINDFLPFPVRNPNYPDSSITFRHLMTHTSSIVDDLSLILELSTYGYDCPISLQDFLGGYLLEDGDYYKPSNFAQQPPQSVFEYSNVGVSLLAFLVEQISGNDFEAYCQEHIFQPLGMNNTSFRLANLNIEQIATPYLLEDDQLIPSPHMSVPVYPSGSLRTSSLQLASLLGMYMNSGEYNGTRILEEGTIDEITTIQYPDLIVDERIGLIWFYHNFFFNHGGACPGALANYGFSFSKKSGIVSMMNASNPVMDDFMEILLYMYSLKYEPFTIKSIVVEDEDSDHVLEPFEEVDLVLEIRNNINIKDEISNVQLGISTSDPNITLTSNTANIGNIEYLEKKTNASNPFSFTVGANATSSNTSFDFSIVWEDLSEYDLDFDLFIGNADILLVNDATSFGDFMGMKYWYEFVLDSLGYTYYDYKLSLMGDPTFEFMRNFPVVIWFCGYDDETSLTQSDMDNLSLYLNNGGKLFLTGQGISENIQNSIFMSDYLHTKHVSDSFEGEDWMTGIKQDPISDGLLLQVNQGWDGIYQSGMSVLEPLEGAEEVFYYAETDSNAAVRFENEDFKTVFFGFGFEGINDYNVRLEVMNRILDYFNTPVGLPDPLETPTGLEVVVSPNPFSSDLSVSVVLEMEGNVELSLYDMKGALLKQIQYHDLVTGQNILGVEVGDLKKGIYLLGVNSGSKSAFRKIIRY